MAWAAERAAGMAPAVPGREVGGGLTARAGGRYATKNRVTRGMASRRKAHLKNEKALTRMRDLVAAERRALPWVKVEKDYVFDTPEGKKTLAELFGDNRPFVVSISCGDTTWTRAVQAVPCWPIMPRARWCICKTTMSHT